jgi:ribosomal protein L11 methylase PrmA
MMLRVKAGGWLVVSGIFETRRGQEEFLAALRTARLAGE